MKAQKHILKNGFRVLTTPLANAESATVTIWAKTGGRNEESKISGLSHFLEHMVFKGSKKRPSAKEISEAVDSLGAEFNAGTSEEWTNFYIKARADKVAEALDILSDMVLSPLLKQEDIDREKGVIIEEIGMYEDMPMRYVWDLFQGLMYKGNKLGQHVIGNRDTVSSFDRAHFEKYRNNQYNAKNLLVTVAGGVTAKEVNSLAEKYFSDVTKDSSFYHIDTFESKQKKPQLYLLTQKREQANLVLGFIGNKRGASDRYSEAVMATILGKGMSSRMFSEVREKRGLAYSVRTYNENYADTGFLATYAGVDPKRVDEAIKVIKREFEKIASEKHGITKAELAKAKEYVKGHLALSLEDTSAINRFMGLEELFLNKTRTPDDVYKGVDKVTIEDVHKVAKNIINNNKLNLAIIGNFEDEGRFEKIIK